MEFELTKWKMDHAIDLVERFNESGLAEKMTEELPQPFLMEHARHYISQRMFNSEEKQYCRVIVCDGKAVGGVDFFMGSGSYERSAEIVLWLDSKYRDEKGSTDAVVKACREVFERYGIQRIYGRIYSDDEVSASVYAGAGFECEGSLRKSILRRGELVGQKIFAILKEDIA